MNTNLDKPIVEEKFSFFNFPKQTNNKAHYRAIAKSVITTLIIIQTFSFISFVKDFSFVYDQNMVLTKKGAIFNKVPNKDSYLILSSKTNDTLLQGSIEDTRMVLDYLDRSVSDKALTNNLSKAQQQEMFKSIKEYKYNNIQSLEKNFNYINQNCLDGKMSRNLTVDCVLYKQVDSKKLIAEEKLIIDNKIASIERSL